jgi:hypothetical protein
MEQSKRERNKIRERKIKGKNERRKERKKERRGGSAEEQGDLPSPSNRPPPFRSPQPSPLLSTPIGPVLRPTSVERKKSSISRVHRSSANRSRILNHQ